MYTINIVCVGKLKEKYLTDACNEYIKRLGAYCRVNVIELNEERLKNENQASIDEVIKAEGRNIISKLPQSDYIIAMCIEGTQLASEQLAEKIRSIADQGKSRISFVIGGSYGLSDDVKALTDFKLSLSKMTFTHQISRMLILEQIYRAFQINENGKYHK